MVVVLYTLLFPMGYMDKEYPSWKYSKDVYTGKINPLNGDGATAYFGPYMKDTALILGDSRAMADLDPREFKDLNVVNLAIGGGTSIEMYYTLNNYIKNVGVPEKAIIMFAPFHYSVIDNFNERTLYFNYLSIPEMKELYDLAKASNSETICDGDYIEEFFKARLRTPMKYLPALINAKGFTRYDDNTAIYNELTEKRGHDQFGELDGCSEMNYETHYLRMHQTGDSVLLDIYFKKLLDLCREKGIKVHVSMPPMNQASFYNLQNAYVEDFEGYLNGYKRMYPEFEIIPEIFPMADKDFGDASHLNERGAKAFTRSFCNLYGF